MVLELNTIIMSNTHLLEVREASIMNIDSVEMPGNIGILLIVFIYLLLCPNLSAVRCRQLQLLSVVFSSFLCVLYYIQEYIEVKKPKTERLKVKNLDFL